MEVQLEPLCEVRRGRAVDVWVLHGVRAERDWRPPLVPHKRRELAVACCILLHAGPVVGAYGAGRGVPGLATVSQTGRAGRFQVRDVQRICPSSSCRGLGRTQDARRRCTPWRKGERERCGAGSGPGVPGGSDSARLPLKIRHLPECANPGSARMTAGWHCLHSVIRWKG